MRPTAKPRVAIRNAAPRDYYRELIVEALLLAAFFCSFTLVSIGVATGIRAADSVLGPVVHHAVVEPLLGDWPKSP